MRGELSCRSCIGPADCSAITAISGVRIANNWFCVCWEVVVLVCGVLSCCYQEACICLFLFRHSLWAHNPVSRYVWDSRSRSQKWAGLGELSVTRAASRHVEPHCQPVTVCTQWNGLQAGTSAPASQLWTLSPPPWCSSGGSCTHTNAGRLIGRRCGA